MKQNNENKILNYNLKAFQQDGVFKFSIDTVLISRFPIFNNKVERVLEVGTNSGIVSLILSEYTNSNIDAIEIDKEAAILAKSNVDLNNRKNQIKIINGDYLNYQFNHRYNYIISNPPYLSKNSGKQSKNLNIRRALFDNYLPLDKFISKSALLLSTKGKLIFIYESKRLDQVIGELEKNNFKVKRLQFIHFTIKKDSQIFLIEAIKEGNSGIHILPPFYITDANGDYTKQMKSLWGTDE